MIAPSSRRHERDPHRARIGRLTASQIDEVSWSAAQPHPLIRND